MVSNMESLLEQEVATTDISEEASASADSTTVLLKRYIELGDKEAFNELFRSLHSYALWIATSLVCHPQTAEDLVEECWLHVLSLQSFDNPYGFKKWFVFLIRRKCYERKRKSERAIHANHPECPLPDNLRDAHATPLESMIEEENAQEQTENVRKIYRDLPEHYQQILYLRYVDCMTFKDIAHIFGKSTGTIEFHCKRGCSDFSERYQRIILKKR